MAQQKELRERRKDTFLYDFNTSGKYTILKEKLKKSIAQILREKYRKSCAVKGLAHDEKDEFNSELYAYLIE